jgi:hypothetical protein
MQICWQALEKTGLCTLRTGNMVALMRQLAPYFVAGGGGALAALSVKACCCKGLVL